MTIVLEIFVYVSEFLVYRTLIPGEKTGKLLVYTVVANTASLVLGILLIRFMGL